MSFKSKLAKTLAFGTLALESCVTMTSRQKANLMELQMYGVDTQEKKKVDPFFAGLLNVGPGLGNFYLASSGEESMQWPIGVFNLLLWYPSVVWSIPEAYIDAGRINQKTTIDHYFEGPGKPLLENLRAEYAERVRGKK